MTTARCRQIDETRPTTVHLIGRCVRRAFLCGRDAQGRDCSHRRQWIEDALQAQAASFAIHIFGFCAMSNHLHIVAQTNPEATWAWTPIEVVERWAALFPIIDEITGEPMPWDPSEIARRAADTEWVDIRRRRLASVSWFMRLLNQRIARRANREDGVTGHFWEGRFTSVVLADHAAVLSCLAYVDLNPIRARMADTPETSDHTSVQRRIDARQEYRKASALVDDHRAGRTRLSAEALAAATARANAAGPSAGLWLSTIDQAVPGLSLDAYLDLVDHTGRAIRDGKRGHIPPHLAPILERLDIDVDRWLAVMRSGGHFLGTAIGALARLTAEAARIGLEWIKDRTRIHRDRRGVSPPAPA